MKLFMTLLVRDEQDIVRENLDYHLAQGVDRIIVTDNNSVDDTPAILREYEARGVVELIQETSTVWEQAKWVTRMARLAAKQGATWVINNDVDEFWWPRTGTLKSLLGGLGDDVGVVVANRFDLASAPEDGRPFWERMIMRERNPMNVVGRPLEVKVAHRAHRKVTVLAGNHDVIDVELGERVEGDLLEILHYPLRSWAQFENKVARGGPALASNPKLRTGAYRTWRRYYEIWQQGGLRDYYDQKMIVTAPSSDWVEDTRVRDFMRRAGVGAMTDGT